MNLEQLGQIGLVIQAGLVAVMGLGRLLLHPGGWWITGKGVEVGMARIRADARVVGTRAVGEPLHVEAVAVAPGDLESVVTRSRVRATQHKAMPDARTASGEEAAAASHPRRQLIDDRPAGGRCGRAHKASGERERGDDGFALELEVLVAPQVRSGNPVGRVDAGHAR